MLKVTEDAKVALLKKLRKQMRKLMAEDGGDFEKEEGEGDDEVGAEAVEEALSGGRTKMSETELDAEDDDPEAEDGDDLSDEDELTRMKREYFQPKLTHRRPGAAMMVIEETRKAPQPSQRRSRG